ncbi:MAG: SDR family NAD(P)-dependent oxidoreductase [Ferruginibacter sp.]
MIKIVQLFVIFFSLTKMYAQPLTSATAVRPGNVFDSLYITTGTIDAPDYNANIPINSLKIMERKTNLLLNNDITGKALNGPYALVAGGSKGIGYAIAQALARRGYNLILIARHADSLLVAKQRLEATYQVHVEILVYDLSKEESAGAIAKWCSEQNIQLKMLCNVAGLGGTQDYLSLPLDSLRYMVRLNIESVMGLTLTLLPQLENNSPAYILNVASMAGFAPIPEKNLYSATKSAVIFFTYSLRYQLRKKNISVSCLNPGPVFTKPSIKKDTKEKLGWLGMKMAVSPERVGEIAVRETLNKKLIIVPGSLAKIAAALIRILPRRLVVAFYGKAGEK